MEPFKELPEFDFNRGAGLTDQEKEQIASVMRGLSMELPVEQQELSLGRLARVDYAISDTVIWLKNRLKLETKKRIPAIERVKFFSAEDWPKVAEKYKQGPDSRGINSDMNEILVVEGDNQEEMFGVLSHELVHCFSRRSIHVDKKVDGSGRDISVRLYGFRNLKNNTFNWFNEIMTETINLEILSSSTRSETGEVLKNITECYKNGVVLLDMIFEKMAQKAGRSASEIRDELYSAYFDGNIASLRIFKQVFGTESLKLLSLLKNYAYPTSFLEFIAKKHFEIDVEEFKNRLGRLEKGEELTLANGIKIKIAQKDSNENKKKQIT